MKVERISTLRLDEFPNVLWVQVHSDEGLIGLGETYFGAEAVEAYLHETVAPYILGKDPLAIDRHVGRLYGYLGFGGTGVETRGNSALDIALWDLFGQATGRPLYQLLGGRTREMVRVYNTCAGYGYARGGPQSPVDNWGLPANTSAGPYEDLDAFLNRADELAHSLLEEGITGMKIWPFDPAALRQEGKNISPRELDEALEPFRKIRDAVGMDIDVMVELHSLWNLAPALKIAGALKDFSPFWLEDPLKAENLQALADFATRTPVPVAGGETLAGRAAFKDLFDKRCVAIAILDVSWAGGLSEAKKISTMAETYGVPVAAHDCTGPVVLTASTHLAVNLPNTMIQEIVRSFYYGWYGDVVTGLPAIAGGHITPPEGPGLGIELLPDLYQRADARGRSTGPEDL